VLSLFENSSHNNAFIIKKYPPDISKEMKKRKTNLQNDLNRENAVEN
jgi:hypothetical protein